VNTLPEFSPKLNDPAEPAPILSSLEEAEQERWRRHAALDRRTPPRREPDEESLAWPRPKYLAPRR
jgi:hypothetical protein